MNSLSEHAVVILERMEPDLLYGPEELCAFLPDTTVERLREIMHELWVNRQVERVDYAGWRRHRSPSPHPPDVTPVTKGVQTVTPEELFDHARFADFFK
jgi:hypothetical protein